MEDLEIKDKVELSIKRFYLPIKIERSCPGCNNECEVDLNDNYLSYPTVNQKEQICFYCNECDQEFGVDAILKISIQADTKTRKIY